MNEVTQVFVLSAAKPFQTVVYGAIWRIGFVIGLLILEVQLLKVLP